MITAELVRERNETTSRMAQPQTDLMTPEIGLVCSSPNDHRWLPRLRAWMDENSREFDKLGMRARVRPLPCPEKALDWRAEQPEQRIVVTFGYTLPEIEALPNGQAAGEPVIVIDPHGSSSHF